MSEQDQPITPDDREDEGAAERGNTGEIKPPQRIEPIEPVSSGNERTEGRREGAAE